MNRAPKAATTSGAKRQGGSRFVGEEVVFRQIVADPIRGLFAYSQLLVYLIRKTLLTDVWQQRKVEEIAAARRLSPAKTRGNRCCQTSVTSENSRKSLLPDRQIFFINVSYEYSVQYLKEI